MNWLTWAYTYPAGLALMSVFVALLERLRPWRPNQHFVRPRLGWDLLSLLLNGHFMGILLARAAQAWFLPTTETWWTNLGAPRNLAGAWPIWVQALVALVLVDFIQWWVHRALHTFGPLWEFHKVHHSIEDGEMDWLGSFRFHWMESVIYKSVLYVPLGLMGFSSEALMFHALFGTLVGHFNHANLDLGHGAWRYVLNSPRMHLWHHGSSAQAINFGIIFSAWDWLFGTAHLPQTPPPHLGFDTMDTFPRSLPAQWVWPLGALLPKPRKATM